MPLRKATKSILFYKGMTDDTERFLAKSPAVDYTENLYEERTGSYSKRPGFESLGAPLSSTESPFMLHGVADTLYTMGEGKGYAYRSGSWGEVENLGDIGVRGLDVLVKTHPKKGARDFAAARVFDGGYVVAFNTKVMQVAYPGVEPGDQNDTWLVVQSYAADGTFRGEQRIKTAYQPQIIVGIGNNIIVFYVYANILWSRIYIPTSNSWFGAARQVSDGIIWQSGAWTFESEAGEIEATPDYDRVRIGFSQRSNEHLNAPYHVAISHDKSLIALLYRSYDSGSGRPSGLILRKLDGTGLYAGEETNLTDLGAPADTGDLAQPLDVVVNEDGSKVYSLYARRESTSISGSPPLYRLQRVLLGTLDALTWTTQSLRELFREDAFSNFPDYFGHGALGFDDPSNPQNLLCVYHRAPQEEVRFSIGTTTQNLSQDAGLVYQEVSVSGGVDGISGTIYGHRLASGIAAVDGKYHAVLQQWAIASGGQVAIGDAALDNTILPPFMKNVSSTLCEFRDNNQVSVQAVVGANASRHVSPTAAETTVQLGDLWAEGDDLFYINRQVLVPEDLYYATVFDNVGTMSADRIARLSDDEANGVIYAIRSAAQNVTSASFGNAVLTSTALPIWLSGSVLSEAFILDRPEITGLILTSAAPDRASYWERVRDTPQDRDWRRIQVVTGYTDAAGNVHRSAPSAAVWALYLDSQADDRKLRVNYTPPLSALSDRRDYFAEVYMSNKDNDPLKLVGSAQIEVTDMSTWNSFGVDVDVVFEPSTATGQTVPARSSPAVYTAGGDLPAIPWPAIRHMAVASRRLWLISKQYPGSVFYSKFFEENVAPEMAGELIIPLGEERDLTAIGTLDDKAVVFEKNDIHIIYGEGPDNRGRGQDFAVEYVMTGSLGCEQPKSVVETPIGLIFYDEARGFYMLDRKRQLQYIGAGVKNLARNLTFHAATVDPREAEVRFLVSSTSPFDSDGPDPDTTAVDRPPRPRLGNALPDNACLSYNYESGIWALYTNYDGTASTLYQGRYTRATTDWEVWKESPDEWTDPVGAYGTRMRSHWIEIGEQVQDYQRVWKITFLGRYLSSLVSMGPDTYEASDILVRLYYDYEDQYTQEYRYRFQDWAFDTNEATYQFNDLKTILGEVRRRTERFQFTIEPNRGRCQSIKIEIIEVPSENMGEEDNGVPLQYAMGRGFEIVSADFQLGLGDADSTKMVSQNVRGG